MVMPIQSLMNMEMMLGYGYNGNVPGIANNYFLPSKYLYNNSINFNGYNNLFNGYNNGYYPQNTNFGQTIPSQYSNNSSENSETNTNFTCSDKDAQQLADYYYKNNFIEEGFKGAALGGLSWMAFENAQSIFHPKNAAKGFSATEKIFKNASKDFLNNNKYLSQEAYDATQKLLRDTGKKGWWSKWLRKPLYETSKGALTAKGTANKAEVEKLVRELETALRNGDSNAVATITEKMKAARGFDGRLIPGAKRTVAERLASKGTQITKDANLLLELNNGKIGSFVKHAFKKDFWGFMAFEALANIGKITTAFNKDTKTGVEQTCQSAVKSAAGVAGWCLGRAAGTWLGAKAGAAIGSMICPGAGTAIGALIGFTVGSIGMWAGHKLANAVVGKDVADKVETEEKLKTADGKAELLQYALQKQQSGEKVDPKTMQALNNVLRDNGLLA